MKKPNKDEAIEQARQVKTQVQKKVRKHVWQFVLNRLTITVMLVLLQFAFTIFLLLHLQGRLGHLYNAGQILNVFIILWLVRKEDNPSYKIPWIIIILAFPYVGTAFYVLYGNTPFNQKRLTQLPNVALDQCDDREPPATEALCEELPKYRRTARYLHDIAECPAWQNTQCTFFPSGEDIYESMIEDLKTAERFIFLEYFIIEPGIMWDSILDILTEKAANGVDVRIMYDDVGCMSTLPINYPKVMASRGIKAVKFNQFVLLMNTYLNYRDHRKLCIIDGNIGFTGGINLADEYINEKVRFGHWKDTGVRLMGDGVQNMTALFLQFWDFATKSSTEDLAPYLPTVSAPSDGYVQMFADSPLDNFNVGETVFMNIINSAVDYVYITSPYLTLDNEMITALCTAAQSGIDVRIVTPGIPDKKSVFAATRSYYGQLIRSGVKIYEYTPGFIHAKMIVSDDEVSVVGTINMDFRSFYLHFECGTMFYHSSVVGEVKGDILDVISKSQELDRAWIHSYSWIKSMYATIMRLFAPML